MGPVTIKEYESRIDRYDGQLRDEVGIDPSNMEIEEKVRAIRAYRQDRYEKLMDAVYKRRGWSKNGIPSLERIRQLGIDFRKSSN